MSDEDKSGSFHINREKLDPNYPTHVLGTEFCEELGRTVATFGFIEDMLRKAIYGLTGAKQFDPEGDPSVFADWIKTLEKTLKDQLGGLIDAYGEALATNSKTKELDHAALLAKLKAAKDIRNVLCHASWGKPDDKGAIVPRFVNRSLLVFATPVDIAFLKSTRAELRHLICDILDSVTSVGYQFPGSGSPGEQAWPHPAAMKP